MLINLTVGAKESLFLVDPLDEFNKSAALKGVAGGPVSALPTLPFTLECPPPPPLPPPPPPPPPNAPPPPGTCPFQTFGVRRRSKLRNFNWHAIPQERVKGRRSLWSADHCEGDFEIDTGRIEELFARREEESGGRRDSWRAQRTRSLAEPQAQVSLLDAKRCMNIGIFLKQFKRPAPEIVEDIKQGAGERYCGERLAELIKHLPEKEEVKRLKSFRGDHSNLSEAELFLILLLEVPSYTLRLEALILKKEFPGTVLSLHSSARVLTASAQELLCCSELHTILRLVLKAGNFMNAGGYAGNAAGFHISSLLKLADTKANKPGMNLLHFVAMEVQKRYPDLLSFPDRLEHIGSGSRLSEGGLLEEFSGLRGRVSSLCQTLDAPEQKELRDQMAGFLQSAQDQLGEVRREIDVLQSSRQQLLEFLCEEEESFKLEECCQIFSSFCEKFLRAIQENKDRELEEQRRQQLERERLEKRRSTATCSAIEEHTGRDELALTLERNLQTACRSGSIRRTKARSVGAARLAYFSCQGSWVRRDRGQGIEALSDEENARQLREVSETVLNQQMGCNSSPDKNVQSQTDFTSHPSQSVLEKTASIKESQLDLASPQPKVVSQPLPAKIQARPEISRVTMDAMEISHQPTARSPLARPVVNSHPSNGNMAARPKISNQLSHENLPARSEVNSQPSIGNVTTIPEVNSQPSAGNVPAVPEVNRQPSCGNVPAVPEVNRQPSCGNAPAVPEVNRQPSCGNVPAMPEVNSHPSSGPIKAKPEINRKSNSGTVHVRPEVNVSQSVGPNLTEFPRVGETVECRTLVKGLKSYESLAVQKPPPTPCAKWKREQLNVSENGEGEKSSPPRMAEKMRVHVYLDRNQRGKDLQKDSDAWGQRGTGAGIVKRSEGEAGVRRVHSAKERSSFPTGTRDAKGVKPSSSPVDQLPSPQGMKPSSLIRRTTLPRSVQTKASAATSAEGWKGGSARVRKETQNAGSVNVRDLDKDRASSSTLRPSLTSPRKLVSRTDSMMHHRDMTTFPETQRSPTSPRPESLPPHQGTGTSPAALRGQTSHRPESAQPQRGNAISAAAQGAATPLKTSLGAMKKPRTVAPVTAKAVKHCDPASPTSTSEAGRSRRSGSQPIWR